MMRPILYFLFALLIILIMISAPSAQRAGAATPTPPLNPIAPTPTSAALWLRPTPTPLNIVVPTTTYHFDVDGGPFADQVINIYRAININGAVDIVLSVVILFLVIRYLVRNIGDTTKSS